MKGLLENISTSTIYISFSLAVLGGISVAAYLRYKNYLALKSAHNLEYQNFNNNFDFITKEYQKFNAHKKMLISNKNIFENWLKNNNIEEKWNFISQLPNNDALYISYKKLQLLYLNIEDVKRDLNKIDAELIKYVKDFEFVFNAHKHKIKFKPIVLHDDQNLNLIKNFRKLFKFWETNSTSKQEDQLLLLKEFQAFKYAKNISNPTYRNLEKQYEALSQQYKISTEQFKLDANDFLKYNIRSINTDLIIEDETFLEVNKNHLHIIKKLNKLNNEISINENFLKIKTTLWEKNEINKQFINSNETYFWVCYDEFWINIKSKLSNLWNKPSNLNLIDIQTRPKFELTHLTNYDLHDLYFRLNVFYVQMWLFKHSYLLKYLIPTFYFVVISLIIYVLYKKLKFVYSCYKTKTLKVTFLNWLFDSEIIFTVSKLGLFYSIMIISLLGGLYYFSGFGYWLTFIFCGRVFIWNWIKFGLYKLNSKYNWYKKL